MGEISKLKLQAYQDSKYSKKVANSGFTAQINPNQIAYTYPDFENLDAEMAAGELFLRPQVEMKPPSYDLELLLDETGAIPKIKGTKSKTIIKQVKLLELICTKYNGESHSLNYVMITYGSIILKTICRKFGVAFTKFQANGNPVRAKVNMTFQVYHNPLTGNKLKGKKSPDLTRVIQAKAGDTLPRLCFKYYGDVKHYPQVAAFNGLSNLTYLAPGQQIIFPPLD